jgi:hypothetical protein
MVPFRNEIWWKAARGLTALHDYAFFAWGNEENNPYRKQYVRSADLAQQHAVCSLMYSKQAGDLEKIKSDSLKQSAPLLSILWQQHIAPLKHEVKQLLELESKNPGTLDYTAQFQELILAAVESSRLIQLYGTVYTKEDLVDMYTAIIYNARTVVALHNDYYDAFTFPVDISPYERQLEWNVKESAIYVTDLKHKQMMHQDRSPYDIWESRDEQAKRQEADMNKAIATRDQAPGILADFRASRGR